LTTPDFGAKLRYRRTYCIVVSSRMAHNPMFGSDSQKPASQAAEGRKESGTPSLRAGNVEESDIAELAAKFAAHAGGQMSLELSTGLALDVVLNEIVEQACVATAATGAAIILERDGEMVCRASSGVNAPELGARLGSEPGLTAECIKTRQVQRCDDAQADPRADIEASRSLGVRSVMILPLIRNGVLAGVLEVFSSQPAAFGEWDQFALEALGRRILKNLEWGSEPLATVEQNPATPVLMTAQTELEDLPPSSANLNTYEAVLEVRPPRVGLDVVTFALCVVVASCVVLFGTLVGLRLGWLGSKSGKAQVRNSASSHAPTARNEPAASASASSGAGNSIASDSENKSASGAPTTSSTGSKDPAPPAGSLLVYENGKEIFRMSPTAEQGKATSSTGANEAGVQRASEVESAGTLEVSPAVAEGSLLHRVEPEYPEEARQQQIQGSVVLGVRTRLNGTIGEVKLISGQRLLADAAIAAVKQWQFRPRMVQGQPVEMHTTVTLNFSLPR
jgi:TonB family protein